MKFQNKYLLLLFLLIVVVLTGITLTNYKGLPHVYLLYTVSSILMVYFGFRRKAIFFDTFIAVFFLLGFWLKFSLRVSFKNGIFHESVGYFDGSGSAFDHALLVASCSFAGLMLASYIRGIFFNYPEKINCNSYNGLSSTYKKYRNLILVGFACFFVTVAITNFHFGIYQKGMIARTVIPFGLGGIYKWLLLFGLASFSAIILKYEFANITKKTTYGVAILALMESFFSNVSLLSRGMVLNVSSLAYGIYKSLKSYSIQSSLNFFTITSLIFVLLFGASVVLVNQLRAGNSDELHDITIRTVSTQATYLYIDRWVGIEGVMAISSYPKLGWELWSEAWREKYSENSMSFFDRNLIESPYIHTDFTKHHSISLPGIVAFFFYPGSFLFLFISMFALGMFAAAIEISAFSLGGRNIILCSLLAQVVAYRYSSFGYAPAQSYLLIGSIYLNLLLIYLLERIIKYRGKQ